MTTITQVRARRRQIRRAVEGSIGAAIDGDTGTEDRIGYLHIWRPMTESRAAALGNHRPSPRMTERWGAAVAAAAAGAPVEGELEALEADAIAAWHAIDQAMRLGDVTAVRGCEAEFRASALAHHEAAKARDRARLELEAGR
jgi:hypothetical protein